MRTNGSLWLGILFAMAVPRAADAQADCWAWSSGFGVRGVDGAVRAQVEFDDGTGPALFVGGAFQVAGTVVSPGLAKWQGGAWHAFGGGVAGTVDALAVYDSGSGPRLYAGGEFASIGGVAAENVAMWNGTSWEPLGSGSDYEVDALAVYDDGSGSKLYVGAGTTTTLGGFLTSLARWDGSNWSLAGTDVSGGVYDLLVHDDGSGPKLYAGGNVFAIAGQYNYYDLASWDGSSWDDVGGGVLGVVQALETHDDGSGSALFVGGDLYSAGSAGVLCRGVAKWDGTNWSDLAGGIADQGVGEIILALRSFDDGTGRALYAGGTFPNTSGNFNRLAKWNGSSWSGVGAPPGVSSASTSTNLVSSLFVHDDGSGAGPALYVGGAFQSAGGQPADSIATWKNGWSAVSTSSAFGVKVDLLTAFDDGSGAGRRLYAATSGLGPGPAPGLMRWDDNAWTDAAMGVAPLGITCVEVLDLGQGPELFAACQSATIQGATVGGILRFDGTTWSHIGPTPQTGSKVYAMAVYDSGSGPALWVAGDFTSFGGVAAKRVARWDGTSWWAPPTGPSQTALALAVYDSGSGPELFVAGNFLKVGTTTVGGIARWNGSSWSDCAGGCSGSISTLTVFDDGSGTKLYAGGQFTGGGGVFMNRVGRWNGTGWEALASGFDQMVTSLAVVDDGNGPVLLSGGWFQNSGANPARRLAKWTGSAWSEFGGGANGAVFAIEGFQGASLAGPEVWIGGSFTSVNSIGSKYTARIQRGCPCPPTSYCTSGTSANGCTGTMSALGSPSASNSGSFVVTASAIDGQKLGLIFYGKNGAQALPWGSSSSFLCVRAPYQRTSQANSGGTAGACDGTLTLDWNAFTASHPSAGGLPLSAGESLRLQAWYRDPPSPKTTSLTDAIETLVCP